MSSFSNTMSFLVYKTFHICSACSQAFGPHTNKKECINMKYWSQMYLMPFGFSMLFYFLNNRTFYSELYPNNAISGHGS